MTTPATPSMSFRLSSAAAAAATATPSSSTLPLTAGYTNVHETIGVVDELIAMLNTSTTEDLALIARAQQLSGEVAALKAAADGDLRAIVADVQQQVAELKTQTEDTTVDELRAAHNVASSQRAALSSEVAAAEQRTAALEAESTSMQAAAKAEESRRKDIQHSAAVEVPVSTQTISLYHKLSSIKFDVAAPAGVVRGSKYCYHCCCCCCYSHYMTLIADK